MKYELIQTYPGYETLGTIHCSENKTPEWRGTNFYDAHPKYWKKVEEVDYKILSFQDVKNKSIITYRKGKNVFIIESASDSQYEGCSLEEELENVNNGDYVIHSVKRLSDGEVFTIGDEIKYGGITVKISSFETERNIIWANNKNGGACILSSATKSKTPLFTTEDGVDIFKGDNLFTVTKSFEVLFFTANDFDGKNKHCKYFSTNEKSYEYILLNKTCLSLNDLLSVWGDTENTKHFKVSPLFKNFKKLAKSKL